MTEQKEINDEILLTCNFDKLYEFLTKPEHKAFFTTIYLAIKRRKDHLNQNEQSAQKNISLGELLRYTLPQLQLLLTKPEYKTILSKIRFIILITLRERIDLSERGVMHLKSLSILYSVLNADEQKFIKNLFPHTTNKIALKIEKKLADKSHERK